LRRSETFESLEFPGEDIHHEAHEGHEGFIHFILLNFVFFEISLEKFGCREFPKDVTPDCSDRGSSSGFPGFPLKACGNDGLLESGWRDPFSSSVGIRS
jgi:hypothetical protein